jgi:hypothetical protein
MQRRFPMIATPVLLLVLALALVPVALALVPRNAAKPPGHRPARPTVVAAIRNNTLETVNGRIVRLSSVGFSVRLLLGTKTVVLLRRTVFEDADASVMSRSGLRQGDRVIVAGYQSGGDLLATRIRDTSRKV